MLKHIGALRRCQSGNVAIFFAIALIPMIGLAGAAIDYRRASTVKTELQTAIDSAVLAGARGGGDSGLKDVEIAERYFQANYADPSTVVESLKFTSADGRLEGTVQATLPTSILGILHIPEIDVAARAVARVETKGSDVCILLVSEKANQSLLVNSGAKIKAPTCEIHVRSTANPASIVNSGTSLDVQRICVKGEKVILNGGVKPPLETKCDAIANPFVGQLPKPSTTCTFNNWSPPNNVSSITMSPGVYCGWTNFNGSPTITLQPGLYVVKSGGWNVNSGATFKGDGVTIYFADTSRIQFNGNVSIDLTAPKGGTYAGIVMYEPDGLSTSQLVFNGTNGANFEGLMYLPSRDVTFNSSHTMTSKKQTMVFNTMIMNSTDWSFAAADRKMTTAGGSGGNRKVMLVE